MHPIQFLSNLHRKGLHGEKGAKSQIFVPHLHQQKVIKFLLAAYFRLVSHQQTVKKVCF